MKLGSYTLVANDWRFVPAVTGQLLKIVDRCVIMRSRVAHSGGPLELSEDVPKLDPRVEIMVGDWPSEPAARASAMEILSDCDYVFGVDSDEILLDGDLEILKGSCHAGTARAIGVPYDTYWKTPEYVIEPPEQGMIRMVIRRGERIIGQRGVDAPITEVGARCRHLSYVRTDQEVQDKVRLFSHARQIRKEWYESVWKAWDANRAIENLHPTDPKVYLRAVHRPDPELTAVLRRWGCAWPDLPRASGATYWQKSPDIVGPATKDRFQEIGQKETRDAFEKFILEKSDPRTLLLDGGCNTGVEAHRLFSKNYPGNYVGLDSNKKALAFALENLEGKRAAFGFCDLERIPYPDRHFDIVLSKDVIEHHATYASILGELARVAGRWLILSMFIRMHDAPDAIRADPQGFYLNRYRRSTLYQFVQGLGFQEPIVLHQSGEDEVLAFERREA